MKTRVAAIACALLAVAPWGPTGCASLHARRPLSRSHGLRGPLQLDSPREHHAPKETPADAESLPVLSQS